jgi:hypothetical protein
MKQWEFDILVVQKMQDNPQYRKGQAAFLVAWEHIGEKLNVVIGTDKDPHYSDDRLPAFMVHLIDNGFFEV